MKTKFILFALIIPLIYLFICSFNSGNQNLNGEELYRNCAGCHQPDGKGIPGFYPPHVGHVPELLRTRGGRQFVTHVVLFGLSGVICVNNKEYGKTVAMPAWDTVLTDAQISSVLNYICFTLGSNKIKLPKGFKPFTSEEIKKDRSHFLTAVQVYTERNKIYGEPCLKKKI